MAELPKYMCFRVFSENGLKVFIEPVEPEEVAEDLRPVRRGRWREVFRQPESATAAICECSACKDTVWVYAGPRAWKYCPSCGADMRGGGT